MSKPKKRYCSICGIGLPRGEQGFNPEPYKPYTSGTCCIECYRDKVLPTKTKKPAGDGVVRDKEQNNESR